MVLNKNPYEILGVDPSATIAQITKKFRTLALEHHPDKNGGDDRKFIEITKAYEILKDPKKRDRYQESKHPKKVIPAKIRKGSDIQLNLNISQIDLLNEVEKKFSTYRLIKCPQCNGTGSSKKELISCTTCSGDGINPITKIIGPKQVCSVCKGYGDYPCDNTCSKCIGTGLIKTMHPIS